MNIKEISISNFRSISEIKIPIEEIADKKCSIFLGKNETGKSNILKAISLLDKESTFDYKIDCNKSAKKLKEDIDIRFKLDPDGFSSLKKEINKLNLPKSIKEKVIINEIIRRIAVSSKNSRIDSIWIWIDDKINYSNYLFDLTTDTIVNRLLIYSGKEKLTNDNIEELTNGNYAFVDKSTIEDVLEKGLFDFIFKNIPKVIVWRSSNEFMINKGINLNDFSKDQTISIPLRNIFKISGINNIKETIELISNNTEERKELEEDLSNSITEYINRIWPEHRINIIVDIENMLCTVLVEDKDDRKPKYKMEQRSQGFKQFISILLSLSIESNTKQLKNNIILLDEPEVHLHPSGVRYLRDELLNISNNNIVMVSSHSIYMVDKLNLNRHFKVDKTKSVTDILHIRN